jgi:peptide/nickel transport system substrate-binding protein
MIEYRYDPDRARELLAEAEADGAWDPSTELIFYHRPGRSYVDTAIAIAQAQMAEVGINWTIINTDTGGLIDGIREQPIGTLDGFWVSGANFTVDPSAVQVY